MSFPVELPPEILAKALQFHIHPEHIEEHIARGSGHGGQKVNKASNCVRLFHNPTGIDVRVQTHREQHKNRVEAYMLLIHKIEEWSQDVEHALAEREYKEGKQKQSKPRKVKERILREKHHHSAIKEERKPLL